MASVGVTRKPAKVAQAALAWLGTHRLPVVLFSAAFLLRFIYLLDHSRSPFFQVHIADALFHEDWARRILGGDIFSLKMHGVLYKAPLYPYFIALSYLASGNSDFFLMLVQVTLTAGSCLFLFLIGKRYVGTTAAFIGALLYCCYFPSIYFSTEMEIPSVAIFLTLLSFYLLLHGRTLALACSAIVLGLSLLALPTNILLLPLYLLVLSRTGGPAGRKRVVLYAGLTLATIVPCTLRNLIAGNHLTPISANGGINFYLGNNATYDKTVYLQPGYAFEELYDEPRRIAGVDSFVDRDRYWYGKAFAFISAQPGQAALLVLKKLVLYFADYEIYRNTDSYYAKDHSVFRSIPFVPASLILASGLLGLLLAVRERKGLALVVFCALLCLPCLIFFVTDRYRLPSMGVWALFSGFFVTSVASRVRARSWPTVVAALTAAIGLAGISNLNLFVVKNPAYRPHFNLGFIYEAQTKYQQALAEYSTALDLVQRTQPRDLQTESELHARIGNVHMLADDLGAARNSFDQAVVVNPASAPAYSYLGELYAKTNQHALALKMYRRALTLNPWDVVTIHNLGRLYLNNHQLDEATAQFKRVLELAPEHSGAHNNLAFIYGTQGKYDLMEAEAKQAVYFNPEGASARYNLATLYLNTGRREEAIAQYRTIVRVAPRESSNAYNQLGVIYAEMNDFGQAIDNWQKALEIDPNNRDALANLRRAKLLMP